MKVIWIDTIDPLQLKGMFEHHRMVSGLLRIHPELFSALSQTAKMCCVSSEEGEPAAWILTIAMGEPGVMELIAVAEKAMGEIPRNEFEIISDELKSFWFTGLGAKRIQCPVPLKRARTLRMLRRMGFHEETKQAGLRNSVDFGNGYESVAILSLIDTDGAKIVPEPTMIMEVAHA
jgi:hypothetical protein